MGQIDNSLKIFEEYLREHEKFLKIDLSEADTRSKMIDKIFIDVLGWREEDIEREDHLDSGYFDYKMTVPGFYMIVEAKKQFVEFKLPSGNKVVSINTLLKQNKAVIEQLRGYITDASIPNGVITNGKQFIIGKFMNIDGTDWKKNECLIFDGLPAIESRFIDFFNNLSRESVIENGGFKFNIVKSEKPFQKIIATLVEKDAEIVRNTLTTKLSTIIHSIFAPIFSDNTEDDIDLIKECFIENSETKKNGDEIERLFEDTAPKLHEVTPTVNTKNIVKDISGKIENQPISSKESAPPQPIILVGSKGAGKTTFINHLFKAGLSKDLLAKHPYVYIDFRKHYNSKQSFDEQLIAKDALNEIFRIYHKMELHASTALKRIYYLEIQRNNDSIWKDYIKEEKEYSKKISNFFEEKLKDNVTHLEMLSKYLIRERRCRLIVVIDNADQFDIATQEKVFVFANSLSLKGHCGLFISLREGYYYKWRNSSPFDAYEPNVYHITAPKYSEVLQKRINYALKKINLPIEKKEEPKSEDTISNNDVIVFLSGLKNSIFNESNSKIIDFLNYTTYPNIREGLKVFKAFLTSGYANVPEFIQREYFNPTPTSSIPIQEFVKAVGLNNKLYYNHETSILKNIFHPTYDSDDHFIKLRILKYFSMKLSEDGKSERYEQFSVLMNDFIALGFQSNIIQREVSELLKYEMIESDQLITDTEWKNLPTEFNLCLSRKGNYYLTTLKNKFYYIDLVLQDTPIYDSGYFQKINDRFPKANAKGKRFIVDRLYTVEEFMRYLKECESRQSKEVLKRFGSVVGEIYSDGLNVDIKRINDLIEKQQSLK